MTAGCPSCAASGWYASAMTNWDAVSCPDCKGTGVRMVDVGTHTIPDWFEAPCRCNPAPTDAEYPDFEIAGIDFDRPFNDAQYEGL